MIVQAIYDYDSNREEPSYLSFQRGDIIQIIPQQQSDTTTTNNNGWSYGRIIEQQQQQQSSSSSSSSLSYNNINSMGWFPTNYTTPIQIPSSPIIATATTPSSFAISTTPMTAIQQQSQQQQQPSLWNSNTTTTNNNDDDDDGFNGTPMGGYIEPEEEEDDASRNRNDNDTNELRDSPLLSPGVQVIPVPERRQRRIVTIPKNIISNISTTTVKVTHKILPTTKHNNKRNTTTTTSPAVYISP